MKKIFSTIIFICVFISLSFPVSASPLTPQSFEDLPRYNSINEFINQLENPSINDNVPILTYASSGRQIASEDPSLSFIPFALSTAVILQNKRIWDADSVDSFKNLFDAPAPIQLNGFLDKSGIIIQEALSRQENVNVSKHSDMYHFLRRLYKKPGLYTEMTKKHNQSTPAALLTTDLIAIDLMTPQQKIIYPKDSHIAIEIGYLVPKAEEKKWKDMIHSTKFRESLLALGFNYNDDIKLFVTNDDIADLAIITEFQEFYSYLPIQKNLYRMNVQHIFLLSPSSSAESFIVLGAIIFICFLWNISLFNRFAKSSLRNYFFIIGWMLIFVLLLRLLKSQDISDLQKVYIWYLYYVPRLIALGVWLRATYELTEKKYLRPQLFYGVYLFIALMLILIVTNNSHELVFRFYDEPSCLHYSYGPVFYITLLGFSLIFFISCIFVALASKTAVYRKQQMYVAIGFLSFILIYTILYIADVPNIKASSPSIVWTLSIFTFIELYCRFGFSYVNLYTAPFWDKSNLQLRIYDQNNRCVYSSTNIEENSSHNIHYYYYTKEHQRIILSEDITELLALEKRLQMIQERLYRYRLFLLEKEKTRYHSLQISSRKMFYDRIDNLLRDNLKEISIFLTQSKKEPFSSSSLLALKRLQLAILNCRWRYSFLLHSTSAHELEYRWLTSAISQLREEKNRWSEPAPLICKGSGHIPLVLATFLFEALYRRYLKWLATPELIHSEYVECDDHSLTVTILIEYSADIEHAGDEISCFSKAEEEFFLVYGAQKRITKDNFSTRIMLYFPDYRGWFV